MAKRKPEDAQTYYRLFCKLVDALPDETDTLQIIRASQMMIAASISRVEDAELEQKLLDAISRDIASLVLLIKQELSTKQAFANYFGITMPPEA